MTDSSWQLEKGLADAKAFQAQTGTEYDRLLRQNSAFVCSKGCSHCCYYPFLITMIEGLVLHQYLNAHGCWTPLLQKRLKEHRGKTLGLSLEIWLLSHIPCALLENNLCIAYEARPFHCRATYSSGDPEACHPHKLGSRTLLIQSAEAIIDYNNQLQEKMKRLGMLKILLPLSEVLLLADSLKSGSISVEHLGYQYWKDLNGT